MKTPKKTISIQCTATMCIPLSQFCMMPHHLKDRKRKQVEKLAKLIVEHGFLFPLFVWRQSYVGEAAYTILDGHGRYNALKLLEKQGYTIPAIPIVVIHAENAIQAKKKLLEVGNLNGQINVDEFEKYTKDMTLDLTDLYVPNVTEQLQAQLSAAGFFPDAVPPGMCRCPKCGRETPISS